VPGSRGSRQKSDSFANREFNAVCHCEACLFLDVKSFKTAWRATLLRAKLPYFRIYDLRSTYATRLRAGGVADEWVTQLLRQGDAQVFKKYSQMKLQMKREALGQLNRQANEMKDSIGTLVVN
jgi:integrase